jgi:hypothetical protein
MVLSNFMSTFIIQKIEIEKINRNEKRASHSQFNY